MYKLTVNVPEVPKGSDVEIDGLGKFKNGHEYEISDAEAHQYRMNHATVQSEYDENGQLQSELVPGRTLLQAFDSHDHILVEVFKPEKPTKEEKKAEPEKDVEPDKKTEGSEK